MGAIPIAHVGNNLANVPFSYCKALRRKGAKVELFIGRIADPSQDPEERPQWLHFWKKGGLHGLWEKLKLMNKLREYDLIQTYAGASVYVQFLLKPFIVYATGSDLHELPYQRSLKGMLMRRSLRKAKSILFSNLNLYYNVLDQKLEMKSHFVPQPIDILDYPTETAKKPDVMEEIDENALLIFHPSRLDWKIKGNQVFMRAFGKFIRDGGNATLFIVDWGPDAKKTRSLISRMRIDKHIKFIPVIKRKALIHYYIVSDAVVDQFIFGAFGLVGLEAMACGKPLFAWADEKNHRRFYSELPPILNGRTEEEIICNLKKLEKNRCKELGKNARGWIRKYHNWNKVADKLMALYESL